MHRKLYKVARKINEAATLINDIKTLSTGDPQKIAKRYIRKQTYKTSHGSANKLAQAISKLFK